MGMRARLGWWGLVHMGRKGVLEGMEGMGGKAAMEAEERVVGGMVVGRVAVVMAVRGLEGAGRGVAAMGRGSAVVARVEEGTGVTVTGEGGETGKVVAVREGGDWVGAVRVMGWEGEGKVEAG